jgi:hypothetical protein
MGVMPAYPPPPQPNFISWKSLKVLTFGLTEALQLSEYFVTHDRVSLEMLAVFVETLF